MDEKVRSKKFEEEGYHIHVTGRHVDITEPLKDYAMDKIAKIERFSNTHILDVYVTLEKQKLQNRVDIVVTIDHHTMKSHAITTDMYVSIDQAVDKLETQLRKYKEKLQDARHHAKSLGVIDMRVNVFKKPEEQELADINAAIEEKNQEDLKKFYQPHHIVSQESRPLRALTLQEAVYKMEHISDSFLVFRSEEDHKLKIIYRREDGNYGVIEVET